METLMKVDLFSDGSAKGNPNGPGGYGSILHFRDSNGNLHVREYSAGYKLTTNNRMELMGVIVALEALNKPCEVRVVSDSKYLTDAFNAGWMDSWLRNNWKTAGKKPVKNVDLWKRLLSAMKPHKVIFVWVKGHAGHPENERCDRLACDAATGDVLLDDNIEEMI